MRTGAVLSFCFALIALPGIACAQTTPPLPGPKDQPEPKRSTGKATEKQILEKLDKMIKQVEVHKGSGTPISPPAVAQEVSQAVPPTPPVGHGQTPPPPSVVPLPPSYGGVSSSSVNPLPPLEGGASVPTPTAPAQVPQVVPPAPLTESKPGGIPLPQPQTGLPPAPIQPHVPTPPHVRIRDVLNKTITLDVTAKDFAEVVKHLSEKTGVQFVLDPTVSVRTPVVLKSAGVSLRVALNGVLTQHRLGYVVVGETVLLTNEQEAASQRLRQLVQIDVSGAPLKTVLQQLSADSGVNVILDPRLRATKAEDERITLNVQEVAVHNAARLLAEFANLKAVQVGTVLVITTPENAVRINQENPPAVVPAAAVNRPVTSY